MSKPDGGQAFPRAGFAGQHYDFESIDGLTLRDYFAGQTLAHCRLPVYATDAAQRRYADETAQSAYAIADAMLAEREKDQP